MICANRRYTAYMYDADRASAFILAVHAFTIEGRTADSGSEPNSLLMSLIWTPAIFTVPGNTFVVVRGSL